MKTYPHFNRRGQLVTVSVPQDNPDELFARLNQVLTSAEQIRSVAAISDKKWNELTVRERREILGR